MTRKQKWIAAAIFCVSAIASYALYTRYSERKAAERQAQYESVVREYQRNFALGVERQQIEGELKAAGVHFLRTPSTNRTSPATAIPIAEDDPPWYCNHRTIYVALEFEGQRGSGRIVLDPNRETLKEIRLHEVLSDCL